MYSRNFQRANRELGEIKQTIQFIKYLTNKQSFVKSCINKLPRSIYMHTS